MYLHLFLHVKTFQSFIHRFFVAIELGSGFGIATGNSAAPVVSRGNTQLMGKMAKFGVFSPAVYAAKFAVGDKKLNGIRGKAISLHSQAIGDFCQWAGAYHLRTRLIKKAKTNGDTLGFLV